MSYLTGRVTSEALAVYVFNPFGITDSFEHSDLVAMHDALAAGKLVCVGTRPGDYGESNNVAGSVTTNKLVGGGGHVYAVTAVDLNAGKVTLYNPWGHDVASGGQVSGPGDPDNDGIVVINFSEFYGSMEYLAIS
jgi:hypothetical protein